MQVARMVLKCFLFWAKQYCEPVLFKIMWWNLLAPGGRQQYLIPPTYFIFIFEYMRIYYLSKLFTNYFHFQVWRIQYLSFKESIFIWMLSSKAVWEWTCIRTQTIWTQTIWTQTMIAGSKPGQAITIVCRYSRMRWKSVTTCYWCQKIYFIK